MLILEGSPYKSKVVQDLITKSRNSLVFARNNPNILSPCKNVWNIGDSNFSVSNIVSYVKTLYAFQYEYIIIYTNEKRSDLDFEGFKELEQYCNCLIVTCKSND